MTIQSLSATMAIKLCNYYYYYHHHHHHYHYRYHYHYHYYYYYYYYYYVTSLTGGQRTRTQNLGVTGRHSIPLDQAAFPAKRTQIQQAHNVCRPVRPYLSTKAKTKASSNTPPTEAAITMVTTVCSVVAKIQYHFRMTFLVDFYS